MFPEWKIHNTTSCFEEYQQKKILFIHDICISVCLFRIEPVKIVKQIAQKCRQCLTLLKRIFAIPLRAAASAYFAQSVLFD